MQLRKLTLKKEIDSINKQTEEIIKRQNLFHLQKKRLKVHMIIDRYIRSLPLYR